MRFRHRLLLLILLPLPVLVLIVSITAYRSFDQQHISLVQSRIDFILANLRTSIEANLSLGLRLDQVAVTQELIERERAGDPAIRAIDVFDTAGNVLFSTDRGALGEPVADSWQRARGATEAGWRLEERGEVVFGLLVENDLGDVVGSIAVTVPATDRDRRTAEILYFIVPVALAVSGILILLGWLAVDRLSRSATRSFDRVTRQLIDAAPADPKEPLSQRAAGAQAAVAAAVAAIDAADRELRSIDTAD